METVKIEKLVYGGFGLTRNKDGIIYFVENCLPNEIVEVMPFKKKGYCEAELKKIIVKSPERIEPKCGYFFMCGGCSYQHIPYDKQLILKKDILKETLKRVGGLEKDIDNVIPSDKPFNYRNRLQLKLDKGCLGFYKRNSHAIIDIDQCLLATQNINDTLYLLRNFIDKLSIKPQSVHIYSNEINILLTFIFDGVTNTCVHSIEKFYKENEDKIKGISIYRSNKNGKRYKPYIFGQSYLFEKVYDIKFKVSNESFFQTNTFQIRNLIDFIAAYIKNKKFKTVIDLYCGVGTLSIHVSKYVDYVVGVESNKCAINDAIYNKERNNINNIHFINADATDIKTSLGIINDKKTECVLLDPPRTGVGGMLLKEISRLNYIKSIIYVSCEPPTLARDLKILMDSGYELKKLAFLDMFPQTFHIEAIVILERK